MHIKVKNFAYLGLSLAITSSLLTACGSSSSSSKLDIDSSNNQPNIKVPTIKEPKPSLVINPELARITSANLVALSTQVIDNLNIFDIILAENKNLGVFNLNYDTLVNNYYRVNNIECNTGNADINLNETDNFSSKDIKEAKLKFTFNNCKLNDALFQGEYLVHAKYDNSDATKSINKYSLQTNNLQLTVSDGSGFEPLGILSNGRLDIDGSIQLDSSVDKDKSTKLFVITANNYNVFTQDNLETDYLPNGNFKINGKVNEICTLNSQNVETCSTQVDFIEYQVTNQGINNSWLAITDANISSKRNICQFEYDFEDNWGWDIVCDNDTYTQNGIYNFNSDKTDDKGKLRVTLNNLVINEDEYLYDDFDDEEAYTEKLAPLSGKINIQGSGRSRVEFTFSKNEEDNQTYLSLISYEPAGRVLCTLEEELVTSLNDVKNVIAHASCK